MKKPRCNLEWNEGMSVGIPEIDADHQRFFSLVNELNHSITERMKASEIHKRLQLVIDDTERHFEHEEKIFQEWRYLNAKVHASSHKLVLKILKNIQNSFIPYGLEAEWMNVALKIKNILLSHIIAEDMQCKIFQPNKFERSSSKEKLEWHHPH
jgi:hemerythrin-like metal-binding protein